MRILSIVFGVIGAALTVLALTVISGCESPGKAVVNPIERGEYLVTMSGCHDCHSPKIMTEMGPEPDPARLLSGHPANEKLAEIPVDLIGPDKWGAITNNNLTAWAGPWGVSFAANLTPDEVTGTGAWTEESFIQIMRTGKHLGTGRPILPPMPWFNLAKVSDQDLKAIFAYLQSLKPIENMVPAPIPPSGN